MAAYTALERRELAGQLRDGGPLSCPACGGVVHAQPVAQPPEVSYVRRRVWLMCGACRRSAALDVTGAAPP
jgi:hypothetical protein